MHKVMYVLNVYMMQLAQNISLLVLCSNKEKWHMHVHSLSLVLDF